jgi:hypothetical protein
MAKFPRAAAPYIPFAWFPQLTAERTFLFAGGSRLRCGGRDPVARGKIAARESVFAETCADPFTIFGAGC